MSDDDEMPELEDLSDQLNSIRKARGIDENSIAKNIKVGVINEKNNISKEEPKQANNTVKIPISTSQPQNQQPKEKPKENNDNKKMKIMQDLVF